MQQQPQMIHLTNITTEQIQKCLDDNKQLIMAILENQNLGKVAECASYQAQLQQNLMYLARIADAQPQASLVPAQMSSQPGGQQEQYVQPAQAAVQQQPSFNVPKLSFQSKNQQQQQPAISFQQQQLHQEQMGMRAGNLYHGMHVGFGNNFINMQPQRNACDNSDAAARDTASVRLK